MEAKHTATPWGLFKIDPTTWSLQLLDDSGELAGWFLEMSDSTASTAEEKARLEATVKFILAACNAHDDLVEALRSLIRAGHNLNPSSKEWNAAHGALSKATGSAA